MSLFQFLQIIWARRTLVLVTVIATLLGAGVAVLVVPPSYEAKSRVMLNTLKPDPVTGEILPNSNSRTYIATQIELIRDFGVAGQAVDALGWAQNPSFVAQYQRAPNHEVVDIRRWLSQLIISHTGVTVLPGTNILEITYSASTPSDAKAMADALRNAYLDSALQDRRREATQTAEWYTQQAAQEQAALNAAEENKTKYEKANGLVMQPDNVDVYTARLRALSSQGGASGPVIASVAPPSAASVELAQIDAAINQASANLGPNHPQMIALKARRAIVAKVAAQDEAAQRSAQAAAAGAGAGALNRAVAEATNNVIANRDKIEKLNQLQADVNLKRAQYEKSMERIAVLRKEAAIADTGIASLGEAVTPQQPKWPNIPLVLGGAFGLGIGLGIGLAILVELFSRRVRSPQDLTATLDVPLLAYVAAQGPKPRAKRGFLTLPWPGRRRVAQA